MKTDNEMGRRDFVKASVGSITAAALGPGIMVSTAGLAPSADIGQEHAVFQPSHGTAPDIAGKNISSPLATILSAAMMLEWLDGPETVRGAAMICRAVERVLADSTNRTPDMGGTCSTRQMGDLVVGRMIEESCV
jgi:3-isopropylmalate dehydrogenase